VTFTDGILLPERRWDLTGFPNKNSHGQGLNFVFHKVLLYNAKKKIFCTKNYRIFGFFIYYIGAGIV